MKTNKMTVKEAVIAKVRETKKPIVGHNTVTKYYAWISGKNIKVQEYSNDSETEMLLNEYSVAL